MKSNPLLRAIPSALAALGINAIPAGIVLLGGRSAATAMVLYFIENIVAVLLAAARVRVLAPASDAGYASGPPDYTQIKVNGRIVFRKQTPRDRRSLLTGYLVSSLGLSIGTGVFLFAFLFLILRASVPGAVIVSGAGGMAAFQLVSFVADLLLLGPLPPARAELLLQRSMGRVALLYVSVFAGVALALFVDRWFVLPFAALKTIVDLAAPVRQAVERGRSGE